MFIASTSRTAATMVESSPITTNTNESSATTKQPKKRLGSGTTRCLKAEAQRLMNQTTYPLKGKALSPTLEQLKSISFSDFIRQEVLTNDDDIDDDDCNSPENGEQQQSSVQQQQQTQHTQEKKALRHHDTRRKKLPSFGSSRQSDVNGETSNCSDTVSYSHLFDDKNAAMAWSEGMVKVTLPDGWQSEEGIAQDRTGRGPGWQPGTTLGDMMIHDPIQQVVSGIGGIYEYTLLDRPKLTLAEFRNLADSYRLKQVGSIVSSTTTNNSSGSTVTNNDDNDDAELLARKFWKRLGPTMPPAMYGADMEGSLFDPNDPCSGWNLSRLDSCLQVLASSGHVPGVTTPYLYIGMWASVFCAHTEDMNLLSINYLHAGAPKIWYAVAPGEDSRRYESLCESHFAHARRQCPEFLRHKRYLLSPAILLKAGIPFTMQIQRPGDAIITFPGSYHFGFNTGFNVAEATNFAVPEWIPYGLSSRVCLCRHDSVRIDMKRFRTQLDLYEKDRRRAADMGCTNWISWREWSVLQAKRRRQRQDQGTTEKADKISNNNNSNNTREISSESGTASGSGAVDEHVEEQSSEQQQPLKPTKRKRSTTKLSDQQRKREFWIEVMQPISSERKGSISLFRKRSKPANSNNKNHKADEVWHLAQPVLRRSLKVQSRVLCIVPVAKSDDDTDDEECFRGTVTEMSQDHVRVHFDGLQRKEDIWIPISSSKLFLDGGHWTGEEEVPLLHYWQEEDSRKRCL